MMIFSSAAPLTFEHPWRARDRCTGQFQGKDAFFSVQEFKARNKVVAKCGLQRDVMSWQMCSRCDIKRADWVSKTSGEGRGTCRGWGAWDHFVFGGETDLTGFQKD